MSERCEKRVDGEHHHGAPVVFALREAEARREGKETERAHACERVCAGAVGWAAAGQDDATFESR